MALARAGLAALYCHTKTNMLDRNLSMITIIQQERDMDNNDLTEKQKALVDTIVSTGCSIVEAAEKAGYSTKISRESARVSASRTLRLPKVQRYMMECVSRTIGLGAVVASNKLVHLSNNAKSEYVQLEASKDILDRVGLRTPDKVNHQVVGDIKINIDLT